MNSTTARSIDWTEQGMVPDIVIRHGIRRLLRERLGSLYLDDCETALRRKAAFIDAMRKSAIAPQAHRANEQHYEVPAAFFSKVLGEHLKYSCACWPQGTTDLNTAEAAALEKTCQRACLMDGMDILELGCGWGSLTLWMAEHYPNSRITAVSNSASQRDFIERRAQLRGIRNLELITADMNDFSTGRRFDRVVSVEMFEHMRNHAALFARISDWLNPAGLFFMHIFCHRAAPYEFVDTGEKDWMTRYFFAGGMMPSDDLPMLSQSHLQLARQWRWNGTHYEKTANAWLANMDVRKDAIWPILEDTYGTQSAQQWWMRWRMFFMACAELFGYDGGQEWWVSHYLFEKPITGTHRV